MIKLAYSLEEITRPPLKLLKPGFHISKDEGTYFYGVYNFIQGIHKIPHSVSQDWLNI